MFNCPEHGIIDSEWCTDCNKIIKCDCSDIVSTRFKDLIYDSCSGERTITIYLYHCQTCGEPSHTEIK
jgi:hypothetical protein